MGALSCSTSCNSVLKMCSHGSPSPRGGQSQFQVGEVLWPAMCSLGKQAVRGGRSACICCWGAKTATRWVHLTSKWVRHQKPKSQISVNFHMYLCLFFSSEMKACTNKSQSSFLPVSELRLDFVIWPICLITVYKIGKKDITLSMEGKWRKITTLAGNPKIMDLTLLLTSITVSPLELEQRALCEGI